MTEEKNRCVVTGLGMICAIGNSVEESWNNVLASVSGIRQTTTVDTANCYATLAAEVRCDTLDDIDAPEEKDRASKLCLKAAKEALADSGLAKGNDDPRVSVIIGSCVGGAVSIEHYYKHGKDKADILKMPIAPIASQVAELAGAGGIVTNVANACAAGTISIAYACDLIRAGKADVVIAGGADSFASIPYSGFLSLHALDENGCSPFNRCTGITLGEGAGVVIVESYTHAKARGAKTYCEVLGAGITTDAHHITAPREDGLCQIEAIERAIANSGVAKKDIGYVNGHGTGTGKNDNAEFLSLHTVFDGENDNLSASSTKAMTGHCLGAAGAIEAVFSVKALTTNTVIPTLGYSDEDKEKLKEKAGNIEFVQNVPHAKELSAVMSNSFAFGGNNASIIFSKQAGNVRTNEAKPSIAITGLGIVNPLGRTKDAYIAAVKADAKPTETSIHSTIETSEFDDLGIKMAFYRKLDNFSQLQVVTGMRALKDAKLTVTEENAKDIGNIVGTSEGALGSTYDFEELIGEKGNAKGSAFKFPNTVYNAAGGYLSICSGLKGYSVTVTSGPVSGLTSILYAMNVIKEGQEKIMLASGNDENIPIIDNLFSELGYKAQSVVAPYAGSDGFVLGDASTTLVLEDDARARSRGATVYAHILGYGNGRHNVRFGAISGTADALEKAIADALADAGLGAADIDAVYGFANGMKAVDDIEQSVVAAHFADKPVIAIKERVGEGRAGTAALQVAHAALMLHGDIAADNAFVIAKDGTVTRRKLDAKSLKNVLVVSFALGGSYTAVVLGK